MWRHFFFRCFWLYSHTSQTSRYSQRLVRFPNYQHRNDWIGKMCYGTALAWDLTVDKDFFKIVIVVPLQQITDKKVLFFFNLRLDVILMSLLHNYTGKLSDNRRHTEKPDNHYIYRTRPEMCVWQLVWSTDIEVNAVLKILKHQNVV